MYAVGAAVQGCGILRSLLYIGGAGIDLVFGVTETFDAWSERDGWRECVCLTTFTSVHLGGRPRPG